MVVWWVGQFDLGCAARAPVATHEPHHARHVSFLGPRSHSLVLGPPHPPTHPPTSPPLPADAMMDDNTLLAEAHVAEAQVQSQELFELVAKWRGEEIDLGALPGGYV